LKKADQKIKECYKIIIIMSRRPRQKRNTGKKNAQEHANEAQGKKVILIVVGATVLTLIILYFSFKSFAG
jgi:predicted RND superfamily exporter protein